MKRIISIAMALVLLLLVHTCALAELKRGDRGDDVYVLQYMLMDTGFLFAEPDGIFGKQIPSRFMRKIVCRLRLNEISRQ